MAASVNGVGRSSSERGTSPRIETSTRAATSGRINTSMCRQLHARRNQLCDSIPSARRSVWSARA